MSCCPHLDALRLVELCDLFEHLVHGADHAGLGARQPVARVFQPGDATLVTRHTSRIVTRDNLL